MRKEDTSQRIKEKMREKMKKIRARRGEEERKKIEKEKEEKGKREKGRAEEMREKQWWAPRGGGVGVEPMLVAD